jgi:hypothetical protein
LSRGRPFDSFSSTGRRWRPPTAASPFQVLWVAKNGVIIMRQYYHYHRGHHFKAIATGPPFTRIALVSSDGQRVGRPAESRFRI